MKKIVCLFVFLYAGSANAILIGLLNADSNTGFVQNYLSPHFDTVDYIDMRSTTPDMATLNSYDALLVWTNGSPQDATLIGDRLADYVDLGGGVVMATFSFQPPNLDIEGRITTVGYSPFVNIAANYSDSSLDTYNASHPIMNGISNIDGYYRAGGDLAPGAELVATWADGKPLAAVNAAQNVVGLALYPGEVTQFGLSGDYQQLFVNSLNYVADNINTVPEPSLLALLSIGLLGVGVARRKKA